jgi:hypothetical protein
MVKNQNTLFTIKSDFEFYCYLKAHLPKEYTIVSEPEKSYYSEWCYHYILFHKDKLLKEYKGNFLEIKKGDLVKEAEKMLNEIKEHGHVNRE